MAIDYGISSLDTGASDITYSGDEGPKSPDQQLMASADPMLVEEYKKYVFEMEEQGQTPISFKQFIQQIMAESRMASGGIARLGYANGQLVQPGLGRPGYQGLKRRESDYDLTGLRDPFAPTVLTGKSDYDLTGLRDPFAPTVLTGKSDYDLTGLRDPFTGEYSDDDLTGLRDPFVPEKIKRFKQQQLMNQRKQNFQEIVRKEEVKQKAKEQAAADRQAALQAQVTAQANKEARRRVSQGEARDYGKTETRASSGWESSPFEEGGIARLGYANGQLVQPGPGRPGYAGNPFGYKDDPVHHGDVAHGPGGRFDQPSAPERRDPDPEPPSLGVSIHGGKQVGDINFDLLDEIRRQEAEKDYSTKLSEQGIKKDVFPEEKTIPQKAKDAFLSPTTWAAQQIAKKHTPYYLKSVLKNRLKEDPYFYLDEEGEYSKLMRDIGLAEEGTLSTKEFEYWMPEWQLNIRYGRNKGDGPGDQALPYYPPDVHPGTGGGEITDVTGAPVSKYADFMESLNLVGGPEELQYSTLAYGGRVPAAYGGIMDSATGRRAYGWGSKLWKKAKKFLKSDIGKAALLGLGAYYGGTKGWFGEGIKDKGWLKFMGSKLPWAAKEAAKEEGKKYLGMTVDQLVETFGKEGAASIVSKIGTTARAPTLGQKALGHAAWMLPTAALMYPKLGEAKGLSMADATAATQAKADAWAKKHLTGLDEDEDPWKIPGTLPTALQYGPTLAAQGGRIGYDRGGYYDEDEEDHRAAALSAMYRSGAQEGGLMDLGGMEKDYRQDGGFVPIGGQERADDVPARLSKNEFVFTADAVRAAGGGDIDAGAEVMENVMENLEQGGQVSEESQGLEGARDMFTTAQRLEGVM